MPLVMWCILLIACIPLVLLIFSQVWLRYVFHLPLLWVEEVAIVPAFWLYMMGAAYAAFERSHIKVDIIDITVKGPRRRLIIKFITSLITLGLAINTSLSIVVIAFLTNIPYPFLINIALVGIYLEFERGWGFDYLSYQCYDILAELIHQYLLRKPKYV